MRPKPETVKRATAVLKLPDQAIAAILVARIVHGFICQVPAWG
jgi:hypothetical protein